MNARDVAARLFAAIEAGDIDAVRSLYAPDVVVWHNHDGRTQSLHDNLRTLRWMTTHLPGARYTEVRRAVIADGFVQQHVLVVTNRCGTGGRRAGMHRGRGGRRTDHPVGRIPRLGSRRRALGAADLMTDDITADRPCRRPCAGRLDRGAR